jgi:hypothetical protein
VSSVYKWAEGFTAQADPNEVGFEIEALAQRSGSLVSPELLVDAARGSNGALHGLFEWDDAKAAAMQRLERAETVIDSLIVTVKFAPYRLAEPARIVSKPQIVTKLDRDARDAASRREEIRRAWHEIEQWRRRYEGYAELRVCCAAIDVAVRKRDTEGQPSRGAVG